MVHLHARDEKTGKPTYLAEVYGRIIEGIRKYSKDLIIGVSLSGREIKEFKHRASPLQLEGDLKPDMGSLTLSSLNFNKIELLLQNSFGIFKCTKFNVLIKYTIFLLPCFCLKIHQNSIFSFI